VTEPPRVTSSRIAYENRWLRLREDRLLRADGSEGLYGVVEKSPAAVVLPLHDGRVVLVEQYRHTVGRRFWECPQGAHEGEPQPSADELARAELAQETGFEAGALRHLGRFYFAYGMSNQPFDAWAATGLTPGPQQLEPEEEGLKVGSFEPVEVQRMIQEGAIADIASVAVFGLAQAAGLVGLASDRGYH
jgi:ADP-ribose pyrophosphatase